MFLLLKKSLAIYMIKSSHKLNIYSRSEYFSAGNLKSQFNQPIIIMFVTFYFTYLLPLLLFSSSRERASQTNVFICSQPLMLTGILNQLWSPPFGSFCDIKGVFRTVFVIIFLFSQMQTLVLLMYNRLY